MSGITTTSILPPAVAESYAGKLLMARTRSLIHGLAMEEKTLGRNKGGTLRFRRRVPIAVDTTPLGNSGATPPPKQITAVTIDAEPQWYGTYTIINEQVVATNQDPILNMAAEGLGQWMLETDDAIMRNILAATASMQDCENGTNGDDPTDLDEADFAKAYQTLRGEDTHKCIMGRQGQDRIGSSPTRKAYFALCHSDLITDLDNLAEFVETIRYPSQTDIRESEHGSINGFAVHTSSQGSIDTALSINGNAVYNVICMGKEAAARVSLEGNAEFLVNPPLDPLRQNYTAAVKWVQATKLLNDKYLLRMRCTRRR